MTDENKNLNSSTLHYIYALIVVYAAIPFAYSSAERSVVAFVSAIPASFSTKRDDTYCFCYVNLIYNSHSSRFFFGSLSPRSHLRP